MKSHSIALLVLGISGIAQAADNGSLLVCYPQPICYPHEAPCMPNALTSNSNPLSLFQYSFGASYDPAKLAQMALVLEAVNAASQDRTSKQGICNASQHTKKVEKQVKEAPCCTANRHSNLTKGSRLKQHQKQVALYKHQNHINQPRQRSKGGSN